MGLINNQVTSNSCISSSYGNKGGAKFSNKKNRNEVKSFSLLEAISEGLSDKAIILPQRAGRIASRFEPVADVTNNQLNLAAGRNANISASIEMVNQSMDLVKLISMFIDGTISLINTNSNLAAAAQMGASGNITVSSNASLGAIIDILVNGEINVTSNATINALANIGFDGGGATPLSPEGLARAVWSSLLSEYQDDGSFGKALADALANVGGGDPQAIADEVMKRGLLKISDFIALK